MRRAPACLLALLGGALALAATPAAAAGPPQIDATWATGVSATASNLNAEVNPEGLNSRYRFEYLTEAAYQAAGESFAGASRAPSSGEAELGSGEDPEPALQHVTGLRAATTYRYRVVATNSAAPGGLAGSVMTFITQPNASTVPEECPNSQLRFENSSFGLPDCRAWEMVSPAAKNGGAIQGFGGNFGGDVLQAAASGEAATFSSSASFGEAPLGAPSASQYFAHRSEAGWMTRNVTAPSASGAYGEALSGVPYQLYAGDLSRALILNGARCGEGEECPRSYSLREEPGGSSDSSPMAPDLRFAGASADLGHVILSTCAALTPEAVEVAGGGGGCEPAEPNLYEWDGISLTLINVLPGETNSTPGAVLGAQASAVSADGSRVYFAELEDGQLYLREAGSPPRLLPETTGGGASFQLASADGSVAYFTKGAHLYRYQAAGAGSATDLTPSGGVEGVLGASADGSGVYYASAAGIFLWREGTTTEVATGAAAAATSDYPPQTGTARVSPDGTHLAFLSKASLTGYDNTDQRTGEPDPEVYLYDSAGAGSLVCVSCNPTGERPLGPSTIPGAIANGELLGSTHSYKPRVLSASGGRLFFDSSDEILARDTSAAQDVYEWEAEGTGGCAANNGCVFLISDGASSDSSEFIDASADGRDAFFLTGDSLVRSDPGSADLYDARELGGFPQPESPIPCEGDACQQVPSPPEDPSPGTLVAGGGNPALHYRKEGRRGPHPHKHHKHHKGKGHHRGSPRRAPGGHR